jgi:hypothetical protein
MNRQRVWGVTPYSLAAGYDNNHKSHSRTDLRINCAVTEQREAGEGTGKRDSTSTFLVTTRRNHSRTVETMALKWKNTEGRHSEHRDSQTRRLYCIYGRLETCIVFRVAKGHLFGQPYIRDINVLQFTLLLIDVTIGLEIVSVTTALKVV